MVRAGSCRLAIARRGEVVAEVGAAADLSDSQHVAGSPEILSRIYHAPCVQRAHGGPRCWVAFAVAVGDG